MSDAPDPHANDPQSSGSESAPPPIPQPPVINENDGGDGGEDKAAEQAKEVAGKAIDALKKMDLFSQIYLGCLVVVVILTVSCTMMKYNVSDDSLDIGRLWFSGTNPYYFTAFTYSWGKLLFLSAASGIGILIWSIVSKSKDAWVPLAKAGCAGLCVLLLLVLNFYYYGFSSSYVSATIFGWWIPLLASAGATFVSVMPIVTAGKKNG